MSAGPKGRYSVDALWITSDMDSSFTIFPYLLVRMKSTAGVRGEVHFSGQTSLVWSTCLLPRLCALCSGFSPSGILGYCDCGRQVCRYHTADYWVGGPGSRNLVVCLVCAASQLSSCTRVHL